MTLHNDFLDVHKLPSYYVIVVAKDEVKHIDRTVQSILAQTVKPGHVILHDDGSTDGTFGAMVDYALGYPFIETKQTGNTDRDFAHVPKMYNEDWLRGYDFVLILGGDIEMEPDYCERLLRYCKYIPSCVVISGDCEPFRALTPWGGGRMIRMSWFFETFKDGKCSESIAHETEFLTRAEMQGKRYHVDNLAHFKHLKPLGTDHKFFEFGHASRAVGCDPLWFFWQLWYIGARNPYIGRRGALNMLWAFLTFRPTKTGYHSLAPADMREYTRTRQRAAFVAFWKKKLFLVKDSKDKGEELRRYEQTKVG